jgi:4-hydroxyphenylacetate 3-monooxygenase
MIRARIYDLAHEPETQDAMSYLDVETGERNAIALKPPVDREDWVDKRLGSVPVGRP